MSQGRASNPGVTGTFVFGQTHPLVDYQPYLGGVIRIISNVLANTPTTIAHNLGRKPIALFVLYAHGLYAPKWQDTATWDTKNVYVEFDTAIPVAPSNVVLWIV